MLLYTSDIRPYRLNDPVFRLSLRLSQPLSNRYLLDGKIVRRTVPCTSFEMEKQRTTERSLEEFHAHFMNLLLGGQISLTKDPLCHEYLV